MDTDSFIIHIKTEDFYEDIANDAEKRFDTSSYHVDRQLTKWGNKKIIGLMKDELGGRVMTEFVAVRPNTCLYLTDYDSKKKESQRNKKSAIKRIFMFNGYKNCLFKNETLLLC